MDANNGSVVIISDPTTWAHTSDTTNCNIASYSIDTNNADNNLIVDSTTGVVSVKLDREFNFGGFKLKFCTAGGECKSTT